MTGWRWTITLVDGEVLEVGPERPVSEHGDRLTYWEDADTAVTLPWTSILAARRVRA